MVVEDVEEEDATIEEIIEEEIEEIEVEIEETEEEIEEIEVEIEEKEEDDQNNYDKILILPFNDSQTACIF